MLTIIFPYIITDYRVVTASQTWRELEPHLRIVYIVYLYRHYFLKLLNTTLHLHRLCWLITESLNEILYVCYFLLLILVCTELLFSSLSTQFNVLVIFHFIIHDFSAAYLKRAVSHIIYKRTIMAYKHYSLGTLSKKLLQPLYTLNIKMVRRLIKKKYIRTLKQNLCQLYSHSPTSAEFTGRTVKILTGES